MSSAAVAFDTKFKDYQTMAMFPTGAELPLGFVIEKKLDDGGFKIASSKGTTIEKAKAMFEFMFPGEEIITSITGAVWDRGSCLVMSSPGCVFCSGTGTVKKHRSRSTSRQLIVCKCVMRGVFRECFTRYTTCRSLQHSSRSSCTRNQSGTGYERKTEDYVADFLSLSRKTLGKLDHSIFEMHFLKGGDWKFCVERLGVSKGQFFHRLYSLQESLGAVFHETHPYALHPVDLYFGSKSLNLPKHLSEEAKQRLHEKIKAIAEEFEAKKNRKRKTKLTVKLKTPSVS